MRSILRKCRRGQAIEGSPASVLQVGGARDQAEVGMARITLRVSPLAGC